MRTKEKGDNLSGSRSIELNTSTKELIENCLNEFIKEFQLNPFNYLYESDIQARIFSKCFDTLWQNEIFVTVNNSKILPVKSEYPAKEAPIKTKRFDIAFIDIERPNEQPLYWSQYVNPAIEIKYFQAQPILNPAHKWARPISEYSYELRILNWNDIPIEFLLQTDLDKLRIYKNEFGNEDFIGLVILFIQFVPTGKYPDFVTPLDGIKLKTGINGALVTPHGLYLASREKILDILNELEELHR